MTMTLWHEIDQVQYERVKNIFWIKGEMQIHGHTCRGVQLCLTSKLSILSTALEAIACDGLDNTWNSSVVRHFFSKHSISAPFLEHVFTCFYHFYLGAKDSQVACMAKEKARPILWVTLVTNISHMRSHEFDPEPHLCWAGFVSSQSSARGGYQSLQCTGISVHWSGRMKTVNATAKETANLESVSKLKVALWMPFYWLTQDTSDLCPMQGHWAAKARHCKQADSHLPLSKINEINDWHSLPSCESASPLFAFCLFTAVNRHLELSDDRSTLVFVFHIKQAPLMPAKNFPARV